jgi:hypothetical protein
MTLNTAALSHAITSAPDVGAPPVPVLEVWYVATRSGTRAMTLDELDEALERGELDYSTQLWIPGMAEWEALGTLANLEDGPPLESRPGAMLEYGLDAERATHAEDGSVRPGAGDIRDYDPFSLPPPSRDTPDPNGALWASILPAPRETPAVQTSDVRRRRWRLEGRAPWAGLLVTGTALLCLSLLGIARLLFVAPTRGELHAATLTLVPEPRLEASSGAPLAAPEVPVEEPGFPAEAVESGAPFAQSRAPARVRYDEPERAPAAAAPARARAEKGQSKRKASRAQQDKRTARSLARR